MTEQRNLDYDEISTMKLKQDLATVGNATLPEKDNKKSPQEVFVTPTRTKKSINIRNESVDPSSLSMSSLPTLSNPADSSREKPPKPSSTSKLMDSMASINSRVLDSDTPRTRKKKMEWQSVKSTATGAAGAKPKRVDAGSNDRKVPSQGQQNTGKQRLPQRPPRPATGGKELKTKTEATASSMPTDEKKSDSDEVRARIPTKNERNKVASDFREVTRGDTSTENRQNLFSLLSYDKMQKKSAKLPDGPPLDEDSTIATSLPGGSTQHNLIKKKCHLSDALSRLPHQSVETRERDFTKHVETAMTTIGPDKSHEMDEREQGTEQHTHGLKEEHQVTKTDADLIRKPQRLNEVDAVECHSPRTDLLRPVRGPLRTAIEGLTFCSVDDSIDPKLLGILGRCYPMVEFAVLMRHDMAGQPRYASSEWIRELAIVQRNMGGTLLLAVHLCGPLVTEFLNGDGDIDGILDGLKEMQFQRVQLNTSSRHGVCTGQLGRVVKSFAAVAAKHPELEFTLPKNRETDVLWDGLLGLENLPSNISMILDNSQGMGICPESWTVAPAGDYRVGYAGGIGFGGRSSTKRLLKEIIAAANGRNVWISLESSLRCTKNGKDVFDITKCYEVIDVAHDCGVHHHPEFLVER